VAFFADGKLKRLDLGIGQPQPLTNVVARAGGTWSADGVILYPPTSGSPLFRVSASGGQAAAVTKLDRQSSHRFPTFLPDNHHFLFYAQGTPDTSGIYLGSLDSPNTTRLTAAGQFSPNGRWVAYMSNESGRMEVYVRPFVDPASAPSTDGQGGRQWPVSTAGGTYPRWHPDGKELYYIAQTVSSWRSRSRQRLRRRNRAGRWRCFRRTWSEVAPIIYRVGSTMSRATADS
jgi:Tol biopolymer transport system component